MIALTKRLVLRTRSRRLAIFSGRKATGFIAGRSGRVRFCLVRGLHRLVPRTAFLTRRSKVRRRLKSNCYFVVSPVSKAAGFVFSCGRDYVSINLAGFKEVLFNYICGPCAERVCSTIGNRKTGLGKGRVRYSSGKLTSGLITFKATQCRARSASEVFSRTGGLCLGDLKVHTNNSTTLSVYHITSNTGKICLRLVLCP